MPFLTSFSGASTKRFGFSSVGRLRFELQYFMIGGGSGGNGGVSGQFYGAGGAAGVSATGTVTVIGEQTWAATLGAGGSGVGGSNIAGTGGTTTFGVYTAAGASPTYTASTRRGGNNALYSGTTYTSEPLSSGAGAGAGGNASGKTGGPGISTDITGTPVTIGGGGGGNPNGPGGSGGGGAGRADPGTPGTVNTGSGGGGGSTAGGGSGGRGVIYFRIPKNILPTFSEGITYEFSDPGDNTYVWKISATSTASETVSFSKKFWFPMQSYVLGGGGGGTDGRSGDWFGQGGAAGTGRELIIPGTTGVEYPIKVGAGSSGINNQGATAEAGTSAFSTITSRGALSVNTQQTNRGGNNDRFSGGPGSGRFGAGGGAGAGANGGSNGGGAGLTTTITGTPLTYGGGGGGYEGSGGAGGGGSWQGGSGTSQTGSGGAGTSAGARGGNGSAGRIFFKVPDTVTAVFSEGVTSTVSTDVSGYKVYTVTATSTANETVTLI